MKQFDVCEARGVGNAGKGRLVVVLQHEHLADIGTVVVAPLYKLSELPIIERVRIKAKIGNRGYVVAVDRLASLPRAQLGPAKASLDLMRDDLKSSLDMIFSGF